MMDHNEEVRHSLYKNISLSLFLERVKPFVNVGEGQRQGEEYRLRIQLAQDSEDGYIDPLTS